MGDMKALFIGAHNDELEYGTGGLAFRLSQMGHKVYFLCVACRRRVYRKTPNADGIRAIYADGAKLAGFNRQDMEAAKILGAEKRILGEINDSFYACNNESIRMIADAVENINPDIAFIHWPQDNHPEHVEASKASFRALAYYGSCEVHAFEAGPWQTMVYFQPDFMINIEPAMDKLRESLLVFDQPSAGGAGLWAEKERASAFRGLMAGYPHAEAYKLMGFPPVGRSPELILPALFGSDFRWGGPGQYLWGSRYYL